MKLFHISDILSVTTGKLLSTRRMDGVYDILNHMTGESLVTHQLPRAIKICAPFLLQQHPELLVVDADNVDENNLGAWIDKQLKVYGEFLAVEPLAPGRYQSMDPIEEAKELVDDCDTFTDRSTDLKR
ncbi:hypothetical protein SMD22_18290 [Brevibacillus halotolerans]|nr:hypothetical protein SMD22_18290 [Brevibacillus halotolerans]